jgi:hypothetical protein
MELVVMVQEVVPFLKELSRLDIILGSDENRQYAVVGEIMMVVKS